MEKAYAVRLYKYHDIDLISYFNTYDISLSRMLAESLRAYVRGEVFVQKTPQKRKSPYMQNKWSYFKRFVLDAEKDADAIQFVDKIEKGKRNAFFKCLLRLYLCCPLTEEFITDKKGAGQILRMSYIFSKDRSLADFSRLKPATDNEKPAAKEPVKEHNTFDNEMTNAFLKTLTRRKYD